jgi:hypothetical protein
MAELNWAEVRRYLGLDGMIPELEGKLRQAGEWLLAAASPKAVWNVVPGIQTESQDLQTHLEGCNSCFLFAATLGIEVDRLMTRLSVTDSSAAVMIQACAAAFLEAFCDEQMELLAKEVPGQFLRPRFSPGYGDFPVEYNSKILSALNADKIIGLSTTTANMLVPTKSITAVIGYSNTPDSRFPGCASALGCSSCSKTDCAFRREG